MVKPPRPPEDPPTSSPIILTQVMDTIAQLKDTHGSPVDSIVKYMSSHGPEFVKNSNLKIKKALKTGLKSGLLKETHGKFKLGLTPKDYSVLKSFCNPYKTGHIAVWEMKRRKGRRKRSRSRRRRRGRRRSDYRSLGSREYSADENLDASKLGEFPFSESRRRSRGKRRRKSRRRKGKRRDDGYANSENSEESRGEPADRSRRRRRRSKHGRRRRRGRRRLYDEALETRRSSVTTVSSGSSGVEEGRKKSDEGDSKTKIPEKKDVGCSLSSNANLLNSVPAEPQRVNVDNSERNDSDHHCIHLDHHGCTQDDPYVAPCNRHCHDHDYPHSPY
ncbi:unnamed protein product [Phyllotreta striolata]|uniref:H15 domain-containing protein n=1 Tax=Phyllotreta striolata TaxID=444603 RepID=A0A9N9TVM7_PHYSR|nr:unnamed protein product [Phyllotreta striolata]